MIVHRCHELRNRGFSCAIQFHNLNETKVLVTQERCRNTQDNDTQDNDNLP